jgi:hypothetical protein
MARELASESFISEPKKYLAAFSSLLIYPFSGYIRSPGEISETEQNKKTRQSARYP